MNWGSVSERLVSAVVSNAFPTQAGFSEFYSSSIKPTTVGIAEHSFQAQFAAWHSDCCGR